MREQPARLMRRAEFGDHIGRENLCGDLQEALERAHVVFERMGRAGITAGGEPEVLAGL